MKDDRTVSLKAAIDAVHKNYDTILDFTSDGKTISYSIEDILSELPSATDTNVGGNLIDRQAAIDALGERPVVWSDNDDYTLGERNQYDMDRLAIETVPSAQQKKLKYSGESICIHCQTKVCDGCLFEPMEGDMDAH